MHHFYIHNVHAEVRYPWRARNSGLVGEATTSSCWWRVVGKGCHLSRFAIGRDSKCQAMLGDVCYCLLVTFPFWVKLCNFLCLSCESPFFLVYRMRFKNTWSPSKMFRRSVATILWFTDVHRVVLCRWEMHNNAQECTLSQTNHGSLDHSKKLKHLIRFWGREHLEFAVRNFIGISAVFFLAITHLGSSLDVSGVSSQVPLWCSDRMPIKLIIRKWKHRKTYI